MSFCMRKPSNVDKRVNKSIVSVSSEGVNSPTVQRRISKEFEANLAKVFLNPQTKLRAIKEAEKQFAGEMFRFYAAILEWEKMPTKTKSDNLTKKQTALKLVSTFVESGSRYENGCLSAKTRNHLLQRANIDMGFFLDAKYEVGNDIMMNPTLKGIVEAFLFDDSPSSPKEPTTPDMRRISNVRLSFKSANSSRPQEEEKDNSQDSSESGEKPRHQITL